MFYSDLMQQKPGLFTRLIRSDTALLFPDLEAKIIGEGSKSGDAWKDQRTRESTYGTEIIPIPMAFEDVCANFEDGHEKRKVPNYSLS